jgi:ACR3 family arsenite efflux pump ArsB
MFALQVPVFSRIRSTSNNFELAIAVCVAVNAIGRIVAA